MLSVIIPTLNAEQTLPHTLASLVGPTARGLVRQVIIVDGGSTDATRQIADATGATFIVAEKGRGTQLAAGAKTASQPWLLFLHADTELDEGWDKEVSHFIERMDDPAHAKAAVFRFALDDYGSRARRVEAWVRVRCAMFALPYGDQGLLISRHHYHNVGGFEAEPLMEDVSIIRRIGRRRLVFLNSRAITSAKRYQQDGYVMRPLRNFCLLSLYFLRVPPRVLVKLYG